MARKRVVLGLHGTVTAALLWGGALAARAAPPPAWLGDGSTLYLQNLDDRGSAAVRIRFHSQAGGGPLDLALPPLGPLAGAAVSSGDLSLPTGIYAAAVTSDRPIAAVVRSQWAGERGTAAYVPPAAPAADWVLPVVLRHPTLASLVTVYYPGPAGVATVELRVERDGRSLATLRRVLPAGGLAVMDFEAEPELAGLPADFAGLATLRADRPVAMTSLLRGPNSDGAFAVEAQLPDRAGLSLWVPVVASLSPAGSTSLVVTNPGSAAAEVTVTYRGMSGSCAGGIYDHGPVTVGPATGLLFNQGPVPVPGAGQSPLPDDCWASAEIHAVGGAVMGTVFAGQSHVGVPPIATGTGYAYAAVGPENLARRISLPIDFQRWSAAELSSASLWFNPGVDAARASWTTRRGQLLAEWPFSLAPGEAWWWWPPYIAEPPAAAGPSLLASDQPIALWSGTMAGRVGGGLQALYRGIDVDRAGNEAFVPYFLRGPSPRFRAYLPQARQAR